MIDSPQKHQRFPMLLIRYERVKRWLEVSNHFRLSICAPRCFGPGWSRKDTGRDQNRQNIFHYMAAKPILDFTHEDIKAYFDQKQEWLSQYDNKGQTPLDLLLHVNKKPPYNMLVLFEKGPRFQTLFKQAIRSNKISRTMSMSCRLEHWLEFNDEETKQRNIDVFIQNNTYDNVMIAFFTMCQDEPHV